MRVLLGLTGLGWGLGGKGRATISFDSQLATTLAQPLPSIDPMHPVVGTVTRQYSKF